MVAFAASDASVSCGIITLGAERSAYW